MNDTFYQIELDLNNVKDIFREYDPYLKVISFKLFHEGKKADNYYVETDNGKYALKVIHKENIENALLRFLKGKINTPKIVFRKDNYLIREYIEGVSLDKYLLKEGFLERNILKQVILMLIMLQRKEYDDNYEIDDNLLVIRKNNSLKQKIENLLNDNLTNNEVDFLKLMLQEYDALFNIIEKYHCLSHGCFTLNNIIVDNNDKVWLVDFEQSCSSNWLNDIGSLFRNSEVSNCFTLDVKDYFYINYNALSQFKLPVNWEVLVKLVDLPFYLEALNKPKLKEEVKNYLHKQIDSLIKEIKKDQRGMRT